MSPAPRPEVPADDFELSDDFEAYGRNLDAAMRRADELIARGRAGSLTPRERQELPRVVGRLRQMLSIQLNRNGRIARLDMADGSYDNATTDNQLRRQLGALRDMDINHNRLWGTRTIRKVMGWISEDVPNWFKVKTGQLWDNTKQLLKVVGVAGALTAGGYALYGHLAGGGAMAGLATLGRHLGVAGGAVSGGISSIWRRVFG